MAHRMGITSDIRNHPSLALGTSEVSLLELTKAYLPFANGGVERNAYGIREIRSGKSELLYRRSGGGVQVLSASVVARINDMMQAVLREGSGKGAQLKRPAAGKTGTSQAFRDAWFIGYTGDYVAGVWVGNDNGASMRGLTGGGLPARIWRDIMRAAHKGKSPRALPMEPTVHTITPVADIVSKIIHQVTGFRLFEGNDNPESGQYDRNGDP